MMLTPEDLKALQAPFALNEHEFINGFVYLKEEAITPRLESIDASWEFVPTDCHRDGSQAVVVANMTIKGVTRGNTGMQAVLAKRVKGKDEVERDTENGEAEKGATTDALKRCARLFGVGRYLLTAPNNERDFGPWLAKVQREYGTPPSTPPNWAIVKRDTAELFENEYAQDAVITRGKSEGWLHERQTTALAIQSLKDNREVKEAHWTSDADALDKFVTWALGWVEHKKDVFTALKQGVDYEMKKNEDYRGTKLEAMAAVAAFFGNYQKAQIQTSVAKSTDIPEAIKAQVVMTAVQLIDRRPLLAVQPETMAVNGAGK